MTPLTTAQAAERLGITLRMVQTYCKTGRLKANRFGPQSWLIDPEDLERFAKLPRKRGQPRKRKD
jgi:excisionase family DNA binding protein